VVQLVIVCDSDEILCSNFPGTSFFVEILQNKKLMELASQGQRTHDGGEIIFFKTPKDESILFVGISA
jgi:hypothetical protein